MYGSDRGVQRYTNLPQKLITVLAWQQFASRPANRDTHGDFECDELRTVQLASWKEEARRPSVARHRARRTCALSRATERRTPCGQLPLCHAANGRGHRENATMGARSAEGTIKRKVAGRRGRTYHT